MVEVVKYPMYSWIHLSTTLRKVVELDRQFTHFQKCLFIWHFSSRASNSQPKDTLNSQTMQNCFSNLTNNSSGGILKCLPNYGMSPFQNSLSWNINSRWNNLNWPSVTSDMVLIDLSFRVGVLLCPGFSRQVTHIHLSEWWWRALFLPPALHFLVSSQPLKLTVEWNSRHFIWADI